MRGLVSCTGIDYCPFAQVDTKTTALQTAQALENRLQQAGVNPPAPDHSLVGLPQRLWQPHRRRHWHPRQKARSDGQLIEAADIFLGNRFNPDPAAAGSSVAPAVKTLENIPCEQLQAKLAAQLSPLSSSSPGTTSPDTPSPRR